MRGSLTQLQVVHALLLRETKTRFGANQLGYLWALIEPSLVIAMFAIVYGAFGALGGFLAMQMFFKERSAG